MISTDTSCSINIIGDLFQDLNSDFGSAILFKIINLNLSIISTKFVNCSCTKNGGAIYAEKCRSICQFVCFQKCSSYERGSCCYLFCPDIEMTFTSSSSPVVSVCGSCYLASGNISLKQYNETKSMSNDFSGGLYLMSTSSSSDIEYINLNHAIGASAIGISTSQKGEIKKIIINDCLDCSHVFYLFKTDATIEDVYLWDVSNTLLYAIDIDDSSKSVLTINRLYSNIAFQVDSEVTIVQKNALGDVPIVECDALCFQSAYSIKYNDIHQKILPFFFIQLFNGFFDGMLLTR